MVKYLLIFLVGLLCLSGCKSQESPSVDAKSNNISVYNGVIAEYLYNQNLPDMESVESWQNIYGPGLIITTQHYKIYTTLMDRFLLSTIPAFIESAHKVYNSQLPEPVLSSSKFT